MGLLGFFSRKHQPAPVDGGLDTLKAQPYKATVASQPPTRGNAPVAGNGPNIIETLQKTHPKFKNAANISFGAHSSASTVSLGRVEKIDRPRTAPSEDRQTWANRRRSGSWKAHPIPALPSMPFAKTRPPYRLPDKKPQPITRQSKPRPPFRLPDAPSALDKPLPLFARERSTSIHSGRSGSATAYVDLLDAQAGINPTDFRQRIQATGARDYGEDVADRNIGENGLNLRSVDARVFYAAASANSRPSSYVPTAPEEPNNESDRKSKKRHSLGSSLRSKSLTSDTAAVRPRSSHRTTEVEKKGRIRIEKADDDGVLASAAKKSEWRKSLPSYMTSSRRKLEADERAEFPAALKAKVKTVSGTAESVHDNDFSNAYVPSQDPVSKETKAERRRTMTHASGSHTSHALSKRLSLQNLQPVSDNDTYRIKPRSPTFETHKPGRNRGSTVGSEDVSPTAEFQMIAFSTTSPKKSKRSLGRSRLAVDDIPRTRSPLTRVGPDEIPDRTSSMRHWSIDSTSATSLSSNPFRPQSRHTANTSIDLSPFPRKANFSHDSLSAISHRTSSRDNRLQPPASIWSMPSPPKHSHKAQPSTTFNPDGNLSSDDDSASPRNPRGEGEEHLLFKDLGFAFSGFGLPGLNGSIDSGAPRYVPASPPRFAPQRPFRAKEVHDQDDFLMEKYRALLAASKQDTQPHAPRHHKPAYHFGDSDSSEAEDPLHMLQEDDSDDEMSFDIPMSRHPKQQSYRPYRYASSEQVIEEEKELEKVDLTTAMRLRKEEMMRKRLSGASGSSTIRPRSDGGKGKGRDVPRSHRFDLAGFDADIE
ncbi:hypothetical protein TruAng_003261 [Truncatella angustata]|nr:hypothetical protein TruAng_003261 [Truncatella angustata]